MIQPIFHDLLLDASASSAHRSLDPDSANYQSLGKDGGSSQEVILTEEDLKRIYLLVQASNVSNKAVGVMTCQMHEGIPTSLSVLPPPSRYVKGQETQQYETMRRLKSERTEQRTIQRELST